MSLPRLEDSDVGLRVLGLPFLPPPFHHFISPFQCSRNWWKVNVTKLFPQHERGGLMVVEMVGGSKRGLEGNLVKCCSWIVLRLSSFPPGSWRPLGCITPGGSIHTELDVSGASSVALGQTECSSSLVMMKFWQNHFPILVLTVTFTLLLNLEAQCLLLLTLRQPKIICVVLTLCQILLYFACIN